MSFIKSATAVFRKDLQSELRSRYAINTVLAFVASSLMIILFSVRIMELPPAARGAIGWIVLLFAAMSSLSRSFVMETDKGTFDLLRLNVSGLAVFTGKLFYNLLFTTLVTIAVMAAYWFLSGIEVGNPLFMAIILFFGIIGFSSISTLLGAVVAQAARKGSIFAVIALPLLLPLILLLSGTTTAAIQGETAGEYLSEILALFSFCGVTLTMSVLLFDYTWYE
jgi:heme exporter protein B